MQQPISPLQQLAHMARRHGPPIGEPPTTGHAQHELLAQCHAATSYLNAIIARTEPFHQASNHQAVNAAMTEAFSWIQHLIDVSEPHDRPDHALSLAPAQQRLDDAADRYRAHINQLGPGQPEVMRCWRASFATVGFAAALSHHARAVSDHTLPPQLRQGHSAATQSTTKMLNQATHQFGNFHQGAFLLPAAPSSRHVRAILSDAAQASNIAADTKAALANNAPVFITDAIRHDSRLTDDANQISEWLRHDHASDFTISLDIECPENTLVAFRIHDQIRVKRIVDHYHADVPGDTAIQHATAFAQATRQARQKDPTPHTQHANLIAQLVMDNTHAMLQDLDRESFSIFIQALRHADPDPIAVRRNAARAIFENNIGLDLLYHLCQSDENVVSDQQARDIMDAAKAAGLTAPSLRALAAAMNRNPHEFCVPAPDTPTDVMLTILHTAPEPLRPQQAHHIIAALGANIDDPAIQEWLAENCQAD